MRIVFPFAQLKRILRLEARARAQSPEALRLNRCPRFLRPKIRAQKVPRTAVVRQKANPANAELRFRLRFLHLQGRIFCSIQEGATCNQEVFALINKQRTDNGLSALKNDNEVQRVARIKAQDMVDKNYFQELF